MQTAPGNDESVPRQRERQAQDATPSSVFWWAATVIALTYCVIIWYTVFNDTQIRLNALHGATKILHTLAHSVGRVSLHVEDMYYKYADTLHS